MGVYWGWVACISFLFLFTMSVGVFFSYSELIVPINKDFHTSIFLLEWLGGLQVGIPMLGAPVATWVYYRLGTIHTVMIGVLGVSMCFAITALSPNIAVMFIVLGVLCTSFMALIVNPPFYLLDDYFPYEHPRHVLATSIVACGFPLATLIFNPLVYTIEEAVGWRITYSIYALLVFVVGTALTMTFRPRKDTEFKDTKSLVEKNEYEDIPSSVNVARRTKLVMGGLWFSASLLKSMGYYTPFMTLVNQMEEMGIEASKAATCMSVVGVCELVSRLVTSYLGDYIKGKILYTYVVFTFLLGVQNMLGSFADNYTDVVLYGGALGTLGGPIIAAMYSSCAEVLQGEHVPALFSTFRMGLGIGGILGPMVAGGISSSTDSFLYVYYLSSAIYFSCSSVYLSIILLNRYKPRWVFPEGAISHQRFLGELDKEGIMMESCPASPVAKHTTPTTPTPATPATATTATPLRNGALPTSSYESRAATESLQDDAAALKESLQDNRAVTEKILDDYNRQLRHIQDDTIEVDDNSDSSSE